MATEILTTLLHEDTLSTGIERSQQARLDRVVCASVAYFCTIIFFIWIFIMLQLPLQVAYVGSGICLVIGLCVLLAAIMEFYTRIRLEVIEHPPLLPQHNPHGSGSVSKYGSITTSISEEQIQVTNEKVLRQLSKLRTEERTLRREHEFLFEKAYDVYRKHEEATRLLIQPDRPQMSTDEARLAHDAAMDAWFRADLERAKKGRELRIVELKIKKLKEGMQENLCDFL